MKLSVIIPTLNERDVVAATIDALLCQGGDREVVVVDGGSRDGTPEIVQRFGPPVRLLAQASDRPRGRGPAYNQAAGLTRGEVLVFLHADTRLPSNGLQLVERALGDANVVGGGFLPRFDARACGATGRALRFVESAWQQRTRTFRWFAGDQAPFVRREVFFRFGGYPSIQLAEDWAFAARLRRAGTVVVIEEPVTVSARRHLANGVMKTLLVTMSVEVMYRAGVESAILARWYRHWLPRDRQ